MHRLQGHLCVRVRVHAVFLGVVGVERFMSRWPKID